MDLQGVFSIVFIIVLALILYINRKKVQIQKIMFPLLYFIMYRTKVGLIFMEKVAKRYSKILKYLAYGGIVLGFIGMAFISVTLLKNIIDLLFRPEAVPGVGLVLPFKVKGAFFVPFFYWIISIFVIAVVHEFSHGVVAKSYDMKIKSSGLAFLGVILPIVPAAFVEPDEKELVKRPVKQQLSVYAAGPFSNIVLAFIVLGFTVLFIAPAVNSMVEFDGIKVTGFMEDQVYPAEKAGMGDGEIIRSVDSIEIKELANFSDALGEKKPGETVDISTDKKSYSIELANHPENSTKPYLGVYIQQNQRIKEKVVAKVGGHLPEFFLWLAGLFYWLFLLNLGIGMFNLVPIGPIDGGRMLLAALERFFDKEKARLIWKKIGLFFLFLVLANIAFAFIK